MSAANAGAENAVASITPRTETRRVRRVAARVRLVFESSFWVFM